MGIGLQDSDGVNFAVRALDQKALDQAEEIRARRAELETEQAARAAVESHLERIEQALAARRL